MKRCPYCGTEYSDDVVMCPIDRQPLPDLNRPQSLHPGAINGGALADTAVLPQSQTPSAAGDLAELAFPDYRWSARDALKCIAMIVLLEFLFDAGLLALDLHFPSFYKLRVSGFGFFSLDFFHYAIELFAAAYFARAETFASFFKAVGLDRKPTNLAWVGVVLTLAIRVFGHLVLIFGWSRGVTDYDIHLFKDTIGPERYLYLGPMLLLAPLFEESIYRGFLYKAFRGSFPMVISVLFIIGWTTFTHWPYYSVSWIAALDLSMLTILQCYLREKSDSLWDCIICHAAFNWSLLFIVFH